MAAERKLRRMATGLVKLLVAVVPLWWLVASGQLDFSMLVRIRPSLPYLLSLILLLGYLVIQTLRWWWLSLSQEISLPLGRALELSWIGGFLALVLPGTVGGEVIRAYYVAKDAPNAKVASVSTVLVDRVLGLYSLLWLGVVSFLVLAMLGDGTTRAAARIGVSASFLTAGVTAGLVLVWIPAIRCRILRVLPRRFGEPLKRALDAYYGHWRYLLGGFALSLAANVCYFTAFYFVGLSLDVDLAWHQVALCAPFIVLVNALPISPGGIGVGETASSLLFAQFGITAGAEMMLLLRLSTFLLRLPGGILFLFVKRRETRHAIG